MQVYDKGGLAISFMLEKIPGAPTKTKITSSFVNSSPTPMTDLLFQCAVPKYITLQMSPASGNMVPPNRSGSPSQVVNIDNTLQGQKGVMMRMKIQFKQNGQVCTRFHLPLCGPLLPEPRSLSFLGRRRNGAGVQLPAGDVVNKPKGPGRGGARRSVASFARRAGNRASTAGSGLNC
jgi:hypothetical protein